MCVRQFTSELEFQLSKFHPNPVTTFCTAISLGDVILHCFSGPYPLSLCTYGGLSASEQRTQNKFVIVRFYCVFVSSSYLGARITAVHSIPLQSPHSLQGHLLWRCHPSLLLGPVSPISLYIWQQRAQPMAPRSLDQQSVRSSTRNARSSMTTPYRT